MEVCDGRLFIPNGEESKHGKYGEAVAPHVQSGEFCRASFDVDQPRALPLLYMNHDAIESEEINPPMKRPREVPDEIWRFPAIAVAKKKIKGSLN